MMPVANTVFKSVNAAIIVAKIYPVYSIYNIYTRAAAVYMLLEEDGKHKIENNHSASP